MQVIFSLNAELQSFHIRRGHLTVTNFREAEGVCASEITPVSSPSLHRQTSLRLLQSLSFSLLCDSVRNSYRNREMAKMKHALSLGVFSCVGVQGPKLIPTKLSKLAKKGYLAGIFC